MNYKNPWTFNNHIFKLDDHPDYVGFVYLIYCHENGKSYIGKKNFYAKKVVQKNLKKKKIRIESDWKSYYGSSDELKEDVKKLGEMSFHRTILSLCKSKGEMNYIELREQILREVLLRQDYYNNFVGSKIHRAHVKNLQKPLDR